MVRCAITQNNTDYDDMVVLSMILMMVLMAVVMMVMLLFLGMCRYRALYI